MLVGIGNILDAFILRQGTVLRTIIIVFFVTHEGLSIIKNARYLGLIIPEPLENILQHLPDRYGRDGRLSTPYHKEKICDGQTQGMQEKKKNHETEMTHYLNNDETNHFIAQNTGKIIEK